MAGADASPAPAMIAVETVVQTAPSLGACAGPCVLVHQQHRVPAGTSIRALLRRAGMEEAVLRIENGTSGLSRHGMRAWLDDIVRDGERVEVVRPINADAKAARAGRVAADRLRRRILPGSAG